MTPHRIIFARILSKWVAQLPTDELILEIGCGLGAWIEISSQHGHRVVGLDIDEQVCSIASVRVGSVGAGIVLYSEGTLPFKENSFQGVYAHEVIEHINDDREFVTEAHRVLKDGGSVILTTPNGKREPLDRRKHGAHVRHYLADQSSSCLKQQGFEIKTVLAHAPLMWNAGRCIESDWKQVIAGPSFTAGLDSLVDWVTVWSESVSFGSVQIS